MADNLKPVIPLTDAQAKATSDLKQKEAGVRKIIADAQTEYAAAQLVYSIAMDKAKAENEPALNIAKYKFEDINNKMKYELTLIEEALRSIRTIEKAEAIK